MPTRAPVSAKDLATAIQVNYCRQSKPIILIIFFYYNDYFTFLTSFECLVISICGLLAYVKQIFIDSLSPVIKQTPSMAATIAQSVLINTYYTHYLTIISIICIIIHIISNLAIQIWVHIHCRKLANRHIHNWGSVSKQNHVQEGLKYQSITNCPWPRAILPEADPFG